MAVAQTGAIFKALTVDGESSRTYGVYITGQAVYNAPQREVEMISIAGRNGQFALDKGRFENIDVTYPAGIYAETEEDFAEAVSNFRNFLCSRDGYVRIEDEYNPNEYRMGVYKSGLEVTPKLLKAGEFDITFDCKPQRWLKSGENAITVASGDVISNPTLFESSPMLEVTGYGSVNLNGYEIEIDGGFLGEVELYSGSRKQYGELRLDLSSLNIGDTITWKQPVVANRIEGLDYTRVTSLSMTSTGDATGTTERWYSALVVLLTAFPNLTFEKGTSATYTQTIAADVTLYYDHYPEAPATYTESTTITITLGYDGERTVRMEYEISPERYSHMRVGGTESANQWGTIVGDSTVSRLGTPTYIDSDIGEAYKYEGEAVVSLNRYIDLGSDLPKLSSGASTVTFDNTITDLKIVPRWWKV